MKNLPIPRDFHYVWFSDEPKEMHIIWYLSILSVLKYCKPTSINIFTDLKDPFKGKYYEKIKPYVNIIQIDKPTEIYGNDLTQTPLNCLSDVLRAGIIQEYGGIYCDFDIMWYREIDSLLEEIYYMCQTYENFAIGVQGKNGCEGANMGIMIGQKDNTFCKLYLEQYKNYTPEIQKNHIAHMSTGMPFEILKRNPAAGALLPYYYFHWPLYHSATYFLEGKYTERDTKFTLGQEDSLDKGYAHHCFFADKREFINEKFIKEVNSPFTKKALPILKFADSL